MYNTNLISRREASTLLGVSYSQMSNLCEKYGLSRVQIGGKWLFDKELVIKYLKQNTITKERVH